MKKVKLFMGQGIISLQQLVDEGKKMNLAYFNLSLMEYAVPLNSDFM